MVSYCRERKRLTWTGTPGKGGSCWVHGMLSFQMYRGTKLSERLKGWGWSILLVLEARTREEWLKDLGTFSPKEGEVDGTGLLFNMAGLVWGRSWGVLQQAVGAIGESHWNAERDPEEGLSPIESCLTLLGQPESMLQAGAGWSPAEEPWKRVLSDHWSGGWMRRPPRYLRTRDPVLLIWSL